MKTLPASAIPTIITKLGPGIPIAVRAVPLSAGNSVDPPAIVPDRPKIIGRGFAVALR
jgi:hypothetical protein